MTTARPGPGALGEPSRTRAEPVEAPRPNHPGPSTGSGHGGVAALAGAGTGLLGLGVAEFGAAVLAPAGSPLVAVGDAVIAALPGPMINFGKTFLGTADKPVLMIIIALVSLAVAAVAGVVERRFRWAGLAPVSILTVLALLAIQAGDPGGWLAYVPMIIGSTIAYLIMRSLIGHLRPDAPVDPAGRRRVLGLAALVAGLGAVGTLAGQAIGGALQAANEARQRIRLPAPARPADPVPAGAELAVPGLAPYVTPNADFYRIDTALQVPQIDPATWQLRVIGMVEREITITFDELINKPLVEHQITLACVSNEVGGSLIGNATWLGWPIREVLAAARPLPGADMVLSRSQDGFTAGTPLEVLTDPGRQSLLAVGMNGEPLPFEHGFPVRMVVPGLYGYVSATKWVVELKVTTFADDAGYWTPLGWSALGPIKLASRIDTPRRGVAAGTVMIAGVAWSQHTGIGSVEIKIDDDAWQQARLADVTGPDTWRQWSYEWAASPGDHTITVRAVDAEGTPQIEASAPPAPDGATGYHSVAITVQ
ncbi:molybdopterin-dependent oxidoreductase [Microlunatus parietis]|uniref:DMSO/TMAO reductase YedYZ molybdopterin-dependent catalytic subunit n=1 Tax=Microlunatus parietis TaxID=682979 RepID=A0A7Y9I8Z3_9ACTN|nr:molybdopterin-dependent oxidoreductase [Microlunatus parietis]NYE72417.1 DMSO/TMAO reductase YedYZ molybdopterin-dependent catalytic subunit [Microlunatus parietis]